MQKTPNQIPVVGYDKRYLHSLEKNLQFNKIVEETSTISNRRFKNFILKFQEKVSIYTDGIIGHETLWELQYSVVTNSQKLNWNSS